MLSSRSVGGGPSPPSLLGREGEGEGEREGEGGGEREREKGLER